MRPGAAILLSALCLQPAAAHAGRSCEPRDATADEVRRGFEAGVHLFQRLQGLSGPWGQSPKVALIGRVGSDLSKHGLRYSHMGFAVRDHPKGPYTVIHLLNHCARSTSDLFVQGTANFFLDDPFSYDALILVPTAEMQDKLERRLLSRLPKILHDRRYNMMAYAQSPHSQNSNQWVLEILVSALEDLPFDRDRRFIQRRPSMKRYHGDPVRVSRLKRLGGLFQANVDFFDQPLGNRLAAKYEVITVRSVARWLDEVDGLAHEEVLEPPFPEPS